MSVIYVSTVRKFVFQDASRSLCNSRQCSNRKTLLPELIFQMRMLDKTYCIPNIAPRRKSQDHCIDWEEASLPFRIAKEFFRLINADILRRSYQGRTDRVPNQLKNTDHREIKRTAEGFQNLAVPQVYPTSIQLYSRIVVRITAKGFWMADRSTRNPKPLDEGRRIPAPQVNVHAFASNATSTSRSFNRDLVLLNGQQRRYCLWWYSLARIVVVIVRQWFGR